MRNAERNPVNALVDRLHDALEARAGRDPSCWTGTERSAALVEMLAVRERLDAVILALAAEWDRDRSWELDGARSPVAWLAHRTAMTRQDASSLVRTARHVRTHDATAKALDAGDISAAHTCVAAQAATHHRDRYGEHEDVILDAARTLPVSGFRTVMAYWRACADDVAGSDESVDGGSGADYLQITTTFHGVGHLEGRLEPVAVKTLTDRLDALVPPDPTDGPRPPRTLAQRRAAALMRLVHGEDPPRTTIDIIVDQETFAGRPPTDPARGCCEMTGHGPVSPVLVRTLACDAAIGRIVMRGASEVLDVGRRTRLVTPALRRTLAARDRTCVEPGCDVPGHWCDSHHIVPWEHHGPTSADNLELRCRTHHVAVHRRLLRQPVRRRE